MADAMSTETKTILEVPDIPRAICDKYATRNAFAIGAQTSRGVMTVCDTGTGA
jgi:hypothetical protein